MAKELFLLADRIKDLREKSKKTQNQLAQELSLTRSSVNAWEMGLSVPSTQYIVALAKIFEVSTDYILGVDCTSTLPIAGLSPKQVAILYDMIKCFRTEKDNE